MLSFNYDVKPMLVDCASMNLMEKSLEKTLESLRIHVKTNVKNKKSFQQIRLKQPQQALLSDLILLVKRSKLTLHSMRFLTTKSGDSDTLRSIFYGSFPQLNAFILALSQQFYPINITHFRFKTRKDAKCMFELDMVIGQDQPMLDDKVKLPSQNPFCVSEHWHIKL